MRVLHVVSRFYIAKKEGRKESSTFSSQHCFFCGYKMVFGSVGKDIHCKHYDGINKYKYIQMQTQTRKAANLYDISRYICVSKFTKKKNSQSIQK